MSHALAVGVAAGAERLEVVVLGGLPRKCSASFPSNPIGWAAVRGFLAGHGRPVRLVVAGAAALGFALAVGNSAERRVLIVAPVPAKSALQLAVQARNHR